MIRPFCRCMRIYQNLQRTQPNHVILSMNRVPLIGWIKEKHQSSVKGTRTTDETKLIPPNLVDFLHKRLNCRMAQAAEICMAHPKLVDKNSSDVIECVELLLKEGVIEKVILDNPEMITLRDYKELSCNLGLLKDMKPKNINDFAPLVQVSPKKLAKLKSRAKIEEAIVPMKHRIYYISEMMKIDPCIVTKFISKRLFILQSPFDMIDRNLQLLLKYIAPMDLLHDLWVFRYKSSVIELRLTQAKGQKKKLMPWMVRCPEEKLLKSIQRAIEEKAIVGDKTLVNYLSERLKYTVKATEAIIQKHPDVNKVRGTRMKEILDYLLDEAGFTAEDIANTPRIFCHSLQTTKERLIELKSLGCRPHSLVIVCKSANEYKKFIKSWKNVREDLKEKNIIKE